MPAASTLSDRRPVRLATRGARAQRATGRAERLGLLLQLAAPLIWIPQAALLAMAVGAIAEGRPAGDALLPALGIALLGFLRAGLDAAGARLSFRAARAELSRLRCEATRALAARSPLDRDRPASGLAASVLAEQAEAVVPYLARFTPARMKASVVPLVLLSFVLPISWAAGLLLLITAPLIPLFMALIGWQAKATSEAQLVEMGSLNGFLLDRLRGLATIRALGAVDATALRLRADADSLARRTMAVLRVAFLSSAVLELFSAVGVALVAAYIGLHLLGSFEFGSWGHRFDLAQGLFMLLLAPAFFEPLRELASAWHDRAAGQAALDALKRLAAPGETEAGAPESTPLMLVGGDAPPPGHRAGLTLPGATPAPAVRLESLGFRHGDGAAVFDAFSLAIAPGEHVALLAPSGAGKSTLIALTAGLAAPETGRVLIDGEPLTPASAHRLRSRMAYIGQRPHIFAGTLASNVALGRDGLDGAAVTAALVAARLDTLAARRGPAPIGEGGRGLSGGEALRLALARLAANPTAGLILADEPTAHLDAATAAEVTQGLLDLARGRTLILATHDPALAARMDRVVRLPGHATAGEAS